MRARTSRAGGVPQAVGGIKKDAAAPASQEMTMNGNATAKSSESAPKDRKSEEVAEGTSPRPSPRSVINGTGGLRPHSAASNVRGAADQVDTLVVNYITAWNEEAFHLTGHFHGVFSCLPVA